MVTDLHEAVAERLADAIESTARKLSFIRQIKKSVLETRRTQIGNQNFHVTPDRTYRSEQDEGTSERALADLS